MPVAGRDAGVVGERRWYWPAFAAPGIAWLLVLFVTPFYAVVAVAMGGLDPILGQPVPAWWPGAWDPSTLRQVTESLLGHPPPLFPNLQPVFVRTVAYVFAATALCILIGYPVAYYIARHAGRRKVLLLVLLIAPFWMSYLMRMLAWVNLLQTEGYVNRVLTFLHLLPEPRNWLAGDPIAVVLGLVYGYVPYFILPLYAALDRIDRSHIEAARDLGASPARTFLRVTLPLSFQGLLAATVIIMLPMFGDYYTPDLLSGNPDTSMFGNFINQFLHTRFGQPRGASLTLLLSAFVAVLMLYYVLSVARATREARR
jgi:spermidine/putrescine transport system permease protein